MFCPYCQGDSVVLDSRTSADGVRRRRSCGECKRRFTTYEKVGSPSIKVQKRSGKTEAFSAEKIAHILERVSRNRFDGAAAMGIARSVEAHLVDGNVRSIQSGDLVLQVLERLKQLDRLSYDRLAANYLNEYGVLQTSVEEISATDGQLGLFTQTSTFDAGSKAGKGDSKKGSVG